MKERSKILFLLLSTLLLLIMGCSSGAEDGDGSSSGSVDAEDATISEIYLEIDSGSINVSEATTLTVTAYDASGSPISGAQIGFSLSQPSLAGVSQSVVTTNSRGTATVTLTARENQGSITITSYNGDVTSNEVSLAILSGITPDQINVTADPATLLINGTSTIQAEVLDEDGNAVVDGTSVSFSVTNTNFGTVSTDLATTVNGFASATFSASTQPGTATVEVEVGTINNSVDILINQTEPAALQFVSADPQRISLKGSGGTESSDIEFKVVDGNGNGLQGVSVLVVIEKGPNGGEYIDDTDDTPKQISVSSDSDGIALVTLRSGAVPGAVTIKGTITVDGVSFSTNASVISIGGGVPTSSRFSVSASPLNIPGLLKNGITTDITAWMSDRYGNYNILDGTTVSFWSETAISIDASETTVDEDGTATVEARTQHPSLTNSSGGLIVEPWQWELDLVQELYSEYGIVSNGTYPRDGQVSILAITQGEEYFRDEDADGVYDSGEEFDDTHDDPFIDVNDNDTWDDGTGADPFEEYSDSNTDPGWDSYNGTWDSAKDIFTSTKLLVTGPPAFIVFHPDLRSSSIVTDGFDIDNGGSIQSTFIVCDRNLNYLSAGSNISVSIEGGGKVYHSGGDQLDTSYLPGQSGSHEDHLASIEYSVRIVDDDTTTTEARNVSVTISVEWEDTTYTSAPLFGIIN